MTLVLLGVVLGAGAFAAGFAVGRVPLIYRRRWKEALRLIEKLSADDAERKRQWQREQLIRPGYHTPALSARQMETLLRVRKLREKAS